MKKRRILGIVLVIVVAVAAIGALGVGVMWRRRAIGAYSSHWEMLQDGEGPDRFSGRMPHAYPCRFSPHGYRSPLGGLLVLGLLAMGIVHFTRQRRFGWMYRHGHMHPGHPHGHCPYCCPCGDTGDMPHPHAHSEATGEPDAE